MMQQFEQDIKHTQDGIDLKDGEHKHCTESDEARGTIRALERHKSGS